MPETTLPSDASSRPGKTVHFGDDVFDDVFDENQMASSSENKPPQTLLMTVSACRDPLKMAPVSFPVLAHQDRSMRFDPRLLMSLQSFTITLMVRFIHL